MAGKRGMKTRAAVLDSIRSNVWRAMRIHKTFTIPDLQRATPGATEANIQKFLLGLRRHGIITKIGAFRSGRPGEFQQYHLAKNSGPVYPTICDRCGQPLSAKICDPSLKKEKEKETEKERKEDGADDHDRPDATAA